MLVPNLDQAIVSTGGHHGRVDGVPLRAHARAAVVGLQLAVALAALPVPEMQLAEPVARHEELPVRTEPDLTGVPNPQTHKHTYTVRIQPSACYMEIPCTHTYIYIHPELLCPVKVFFLSCRTLSPQE